MFALKSKVQRPSVRRKDNKFQRNLRTLAIHLAPPSTVVVRAFQPINVAHRQCKIYMLSSANNKRQMSPPSPHLPLCVVVITRSKLTLNHPNSAAAARTAHNVVFLFVSRLYGSSLILLVWSFVRAMFILVKLNFTFNFPFVAFFLVRKSVNYKGLARRAAAEHVSHGSFFIAIAAIMALRAMQFCQHLLVRASLICHLDSSSKKRPVCWPNSFAAHLPGM